MATESRCAIDFILLPYDIPSLFVLVVRKTAVSVESRKIILSFKLWNTFEVGFYMKQLRVLSDL